jgi:hypothetical protein
MDNKIIELENGTKIIVDGDFKKHIRNDSMWHVIGNDTFGIFKKESDGIFWVTNDK